MKKTSVSYNCDVNTANEKVQELKKDGYLIVDTYGDDYDTGQILMKGETFKEKEEVLGLYLKHVENCKLKTKIREGMK